MKQCHRCLMIKSIGAFRERRRTCLQCEAETSHARKVSSPVTYLSTLLTAARIRHKTTQSTKPCVDLEYLVTLWRKQDGRCALTGVTLTHSRARGHHRRTATNVSVDRISPRRGYVKGNVRLVAFAVNRARNDLSDAAFLRLCSDVVRTYTRRAGITVQYDAGVLHYWGHENGRRKRQRRR